MIMTSIVYENTKTTLPGWVNTVHLNQPRGMAYDAGSHFVHFYGTGSDLFVVSVGLTATEKKNGLLNDWATKVFGAKDIRNAKHAPGTTVAGVWRPGLYFLEETLQGLGNTEAEQRAAEQALRLLVERLDELLLYIEPDHHGLKAFSHKTRELLILGSTEVENTWKYHMRLSGASPSNGRDFTTNDYVRLLTPLYLADFEVLVKPYAAVAPMRPFARWNAGAPTTSLPWYDAYNKTKHDRSAHFAEATLEHCFSAVAANLVMFATRFSPFPLIEGRGPLAPLVNHLFTLRLHNPDPTTFYVPKLKLPAGMRDDLVCGNRKDVLEAWSVRAFVL